MSGTGIYSELASDPDLGELVELFVSELPDRVSSVEQAFESRDLPQLRTLAHQLKGASGSYGFHQITPIAGELEKAAEQSVEEAELARCVADLAEICGLARAGEPE